MLYIYIYTLFFLSLNRKFDSYIEILFRQSITNYQLSERFKNNFLFVNQFNQSMRIFFLKKKKEIITKRVSKSKQTFKEREEIVSSIFLSFIY